MKIDALSLCTWKNTRATIIEIAELWLVKAYNSDASPSVGSFF